MKDKAKELINQYKARFTSFGISDNIALIEAKICALIHVNGIIKAIANPKNVSYKQSVEKIEAIKSINQVNVDYWQEVKSELEKM